MDLAAAGGMAALDPDNHHAMLCTAGGKIPSLRHKSFYVLYGGGVIRVGMGRHGAPTLSAWTPCVVHGDYVITVGVIACRD